MCRDLAFPFPPCRDVGVHSDGQQQMSSQRMWLGCICRACESLWNHALGEDQRTARGVGWDRGLSLRLRPRAVCSGSERTSWLGRLCCTEAPRSQRWGCRWKSAKAPTSGREPGTAEAATAVLHEAVLEASCSKQFSWSASLGSAVQGTQDLSFLWLAWCWFTGTASEYLGRVWTRRAQWTTHPN